MAAVQVTLTRQAAMATRTRMWWHDTAVAAAQPLLRAVQSRTLAQLRAALAKHEGEIPARVMVAAGQLAWQEGLAALVKAGGDLNAPYRNYRPLHALIQEDPHRAGTLTPARAACLEWMLGHGADPELPGAWPSSRALVIAAFQGEWPYVDALKDAGAKINIFSAAALGDGTKVASLLGRSPSLATAHDVGGGVTALHCCAGSRLGRARPRTAAGLLACARRLINAGAGTNARAKSWKHEVSPAYFAIRSGQIDILTLLLDHGASADEALPTAAWDGRWDIVDLLRERGASLDVPDGDRPLLNNLVRWGQFQQARQLLERGADPNRPDGQGSTAMHQAASRGNVKMWEALVAAGGDETRRDTEGRTPRDVARGHTVARLARRVVRTIRSRS